MKLGPYELDRIYTGDARELAKDLPDESVDLIFTDPVYQNIDDYRWLAETAARVLKPHKSVLAFCAHAKEILVGSAMLSSELVPGPVLEHIVTASVGRLFSHSLQCNVIPCLWFSKGLPDSEWQYLEVQAPIKGKRGHKWGKAVSMIAYRIEKFTNSGDIILDPFCGGGTVPAVCKMLDRRYLAFEICPDTADLARQRVANTQPPLPGINQMVQMSMEEA